MLVLAQLSSSLTSYLRPLFLLFSYLTTLARYDLIYEVRDRSRFLEGLLRSAGIGAGGGLDGREMEEGMDCLERGRTLRVDQVREVLFSGVRGKGGGSLFGELGFDLAFFFFFSPMEMS